MSDYKQTRDAAGKVTTQYDKMLRNLDDDDLVKRARHNAISDMPHYASVSLIGEMADRIEELEERLKAATDDAKEAEAYAGELEAVLESIKAKLAACEKYRDVYAECDRIGTQAVRDLEAKLVKAVEAFRVLSDYENLDRSGGYYDGGCCILSYQARKRYGDFDEIARTTIAELTGGNDE
jgi:chromosome segregation ATPase